MDIADWLRTLGLEQYAPMFRQNEIDYEVLPELSDADLERLGVPMGHRKRLLRAISALSVAASAAFGGDLNEAPLVDERVSVRQTLSI